MLKQLLNNSQGKHISSELLDEISLTEVNGSYPGVLTLLLLIDLIETIGWVEHTGDWDLELIVTTYKGETFETGPGYASSTLITLNGQSIHREWTILAEEEKVERLKLTFEDHEENEDYDGFSVLIKDIKTIEITR